MKLSFNRSWRCRREGSAEAVPVTLPHDAMQSAERRPDSPGGGSMAYYTGGVYHYEKQFFAEEAWSEQYVTLELEAVYRNARVYLNDRLVGGRPNGYFPFFVPLDDALRYGESNSLRVVADAAQLPCSRWYSGAGMIRPVWLHVKPKTHIAIGGVRVTTLSHAPARILVETEHNGADIGVAVLDGDTVLARGTGGSVELSLPGAELWSAEHPKLYLCRVELLGNGAVVDTEELSFGVRTIDWSPAGLRINGVETMLRGGCIHHDNGILGAASFPESEERRVRLLKEAGFNALRSAHNPASPALLEACDRLGMYVMDETWDVWYTGKKEFDYSNDFLENYRGDIQALVRRDYNHPSVILYSLGNEVTEPAEERGVALLREMTALAHTLDTTRPVTAGINITLLLMSQMGMMASTQEAPSVPPELAGKQGSEQFNAMTAMFGRRMTEAAGSEQADSVSSPCFAELDIAGYNYAAGRYAIDGTLHPERVIVGAETYPQDIYHNWEAVKRYPYLIGDFIWTAWDYLGEAGIGTWAYTEDGRSFDKPYPWLLADAGAFDILGTPGAPAAYCGVVWGTRTEPYIGVQPVNHPGIIPAKAIWRGTNAMASWAWAGCEGHEAVVEVYAQGHCAELRLCGSVVGRQEIHECKAVFTLPYAPGTLEAVVCDASGAELGRSALTSAKPELRLLLTADKASLRPEGISYVDIALADEAGVCEMNSDRLLTASVQGGELLALGSANPRTEERYTEGRFTSYYGRAQAVVRAEPGSRVLCLTVSAAGLEPVTLTWEVEDEQ